MRVHRKALKIAIAISEGGGGVYFKTAGSMTTPGLVVRREAIAKFGKKVYEYRAYTGSTGYIPFGETFGELIKVIRSLETYEAV